MFSYCHEDYSLAIVACRAYVLQASSFQSVASWYVSVCFRYDFDDYFDDANDIIMSYDNGSLAFRLLFTDILDN